MANVEGTVTGRQDPIIIGRGAELAAIDRFLDPSIPGPPVLVLIGESGIGKTTLWRHAVVAAAARFRVLSCRPAQSEIKLSFGALTDLFGGIQPDELSELPDPQRRALQAALLLEQPDADVDERAVSAGLLGLLRTMSSRGPVLIAADDIQWLDDSSARVLGFVLRRLEGIHCRVLAVDRRQHGHQRAAILQGFPRDVSEELPVRPMNITLEDLGLLVATRLGVSSSRHVLQKLHAATGGNPLFALEMARALQRSQAETGPGEPLPIPNTLRDLLSDRLTVLPEAVTTVIKIASMLSEPRVSLIVGSLEAEDADALAHIDEAVEAGIFELSGEAVRFSHPLLGVITYSSMGLSERRRLHRRLAGVVAELEEQARHLALSAGQPDEKIAQTLELAAHQAMNRGAPSAAAELADLAWRLSPPNLPDDVAGRKVQAADYHIATGDMASARSLLTDVISTPSPGENRARALLLLGDWTTDPRAAIPLMHEALSEASGDPSLEVEIHRSLISQLLSAGYIESADAHAMTALEIAERREDARELSTALVSRAETQFMLGHGLQGDLLARARGLEGGYRSNLVAAWLRSTSGDMAGGRDGLGAVLARAEDRGEDIAASAALLWMSDLEYRAGNWDAAARCADRGHALAVRTNWEPVIPYGLFCQARVQAGRGDVESARRNALESLSMWEAMGQSMYEVVFVIPLLGFIDLSSGRHKAAVERLGPLPARCASIGLGEPGFMRFIPDLVESLVAVGRPEEAARVLRPFERASRELGRAFGLAASARCRALLLAARGQKEKAQAAASQALAAHDRSEEPFERARTLLVVGELHRRLKQKGPARVAMEGALEVFDRLRARLWSERAHRELDRLGKRPPSPWDLTPTQLRIAELVAAGNTNEEVARALFLSSKTVAGNLTNIYAKLGVRSRTELSAKIRAPDSSE